MQAAEELSQTIYKYKTRQQEQDGRQDERHKVAESKKAHVKQQCEQDHHETDQQKADAGSHRPYRDLVKGRERGGGCQDLNLPLLLTVVT